MTRTPDSLTEVYPNLSPEIPTEREESIIASFYKGQGRRPSARKSSRVAENFLYVRIDDM